MNVQSLIIEKYPQIIKLQNSCFSLKEIYNIIFANNEVNYSTFRVFVPKIKNKTIHPEYNKISILMPIYHDMPITQNLYINFNGILILFNTSNIKKEWLINENNFIEHIVNPAGLIYAKHFLQLYHLDNQSILNQSFDKWKIPLSKTNSLIIQNISHTIKNDYATILSELKAKTLESILI